MSTDDPILSYAVPANRTTVSRPRRVLRFGVRWLLPPVAAFATIVVGVGVSQAMTLGVLNGLAAVVLTAALIVVVGASARALRGTRARRVIVYVEQAVRLALPMPDFLLASARSETPLVAARLRDIATELAGGVRLGDALQNAVPELPLRTSALVRAATDNAALPATLTRLAAEPAVSASRDASRRLPWLYFGVMVIVLPAVVLLLCVFTLPKWLQIFRDFGLPTPPLLAMFANVDTAWFFITCAGLLVGAAAIGSTVSRSFRWILLGRHDAGSTFGTLRARLAWRVPIVGAISRDRDHADACQTIADGLAFGRPIDAVLAEAGALDLNAVLRERLRLWRRFAEAGQPLNVAARAAGMAGLVADFAGPLASPDAFAFLARHYRHRASRRGKWWIAFAMPSLTLAFGGLVGLVAFAVFDAVARLIDAVAPYPGGI